MSAKLPRDRDHLIEPLFAGLRAEEAPSTHEASSKPAPRIRHLWALWVVLLLVLLGSGYLLWSS